MDKVILSIYYKPLHKFIIIIYRSFSRARASYYMTKLKELSSMVREEAKIIRTIDNVPADTDNNNHIEHFTDTFTDTITEII